MTRTGRFLTLYLCSVAGVGAMLALGWTRTGGVWFGLDDPYIHLAFAEQLAAGHFGSTPGLVSAPSSSLLWPVLLVPGAWFAVGEAWLWGLLLASLALAVAASLAASERIVAEPRGQLLLAGWLLWVGNVVPLTLLGLEHVLQVALTIAIAAASLDPARGRVLPRWSLPALAALPLVRLEGLVPAALVAAYAAWRGDRRGLGAFALGAALLGLGLGGIHAQTGHVLPGSILSKLDSIPAAWATPGHPWVAGLWLVAALGLLPVGGRRDLGALATTVVAAHLLFGRASAHDRYVPYALAAGAVWIAARLGDPRNPASPLVQRTVAASLFTVHVPSWASQPALAERTWAIHDVFRELRVAVGGPVATHDIGLVSWGSPATVVDLLGLGDVPILDAWLAGHPEPTMQEECAAHGVHVAFGLDTFFRRDLTGWVRVATLDATVGSGMERILVYATAPEWAEEARAAVRAAEPRIQDRRRVAWSADEGNSL